MPVRHYYNEFDPKSAAWLRALIAAKLIPEGTVDERSITEVQPADLVGFTQCHFFAGIGGWPLALRLAEWPEDREVWTGSCPCQPYSNAGKQQGDDDERNLWPEMSRIIKGFKPKPVTIIGEQVEAAIRFGWLDGISTDLEREGYAVGSVVLGAHSVGAPHIRQRLYWVANSTSDGRAQYVKESWEREVAKENYAAKHNSISGMAEPSGTERRRGPEPVGEYRQSLHIANRWLVNATCGGEKPEEQPRQRHGLVSSGIRMGGPIKPGLEGLAGDGNNGYESRRIAAEEARPATPPSVSLWDQSQWHQCKDGKARRIPLEPTLFPLANGIPGRVGLLRGAGNAIVPQVAAEFVKAFMQVMKEAETHYRDDLRILNGVIPPHAM